MIDVSNTGRNLITVSVLCTLLVIWLGTRYVSDAHKQFAEAAHLQRSVIPEVTLYKIADNIEQQRSLTQQILVESTEFDQLQERLELLQAQSIVLASTARQEISLFLNRASHRVQRRYSEESTNKLMEKLEDRLSHLSFTNSAIISQAYTPYTNRDETLRMQLYDAHTDLITATDQIRNQAKALPQNNYTSVLSAYELKEHIWTINDSINQTTTLLKSLLGKYETGTHSQINEENLTLRVIQQQEKISDALSELTNLLDNNFVEGIPTYKLEELSKFYNNEFIDKVKSISASYKQASPPTITTEQWANTTNQIKERIDNLKFLANAITLSTASTIQQQAMKSLCLNAVFIMIFTAMAYATFKTAKNIQHRADHDELTGLPNRRYFFQLLQSLLKRTDAAKQDKIVLMSLDLHGFKAIEDSMGNTVADKLLKKIVQRILSTLDDNTLTARTGGDEFAIAYKIDMLADPAILAKQIRDTFIESFSIQDALVKIDISIGYSIYPDDADTMDTLVSASDFAMFNAKQSCSSKIQPYNKHIAEQHEKRISIEKELVVAIEQDELELYYQPQFNLAKNTAHSVEALIRWNHPTRGLVSPLEFIDIAEKAGLMPALGNWVLQEACRQSAEWAAHTNIPIRVAVNVSVHQLMQSTFVQDVIDATETHNIPAGSLELEITESVGMSDITHIIDCLKTLKEHGFTIALDDFGTGYSSLSQLQELPLDILKIDRSFIKDLDQTSTTMKSVTTTIASIAAIYGLETVAEGIETEEQLIEVRKLGIDIAQGYYYSKPVSKHEVLDAIENIHRFAERQHRKSA